MGRWSQSRRTGGGASLNFMVRAVIIDTVTAHVYFDKVLEASLIDWTEWSSSTSGSVGDSATNIAPSVVALEFDNTITGDTTIVYSGTNPGIIADQSLLYD
jgi:hypothetical protein